MSRQKHREDKWTKFQEEFKTIKTIRDFRKFCLDLLVCIYDLWISDAGYSTISSISWYIIIIGLCMVPLLFYLLIYSLFISFSLPIPHPSVAILLLVHLCSHKMCIIILCWWNFNLWNWYFVTHLIPSYLFPDFALLLVSIHVLNFCFFLLLNAPWWISTTFLFSGFQWMDTQVAVHLLCLPYVINNLIYFPLWNCVRTSFWLIPDEESH